MTAPVIDAIEINHYLELLFPDPPADAWLVVSWPDGSRQLLSKWFRSPETDQAVKFLARQARRTNMYVGLGLRHPDCTAEEHSRGTSEKVYAIGGLWIEFDHSKGVHTSRYLPTPDELLAFIHELPFTFSLLIDSSGGYHGYLLFRELWLLDTPEEHQAAALLLRRFQRTIQARAADRGWKVDTTADLARVLRPGGTLNHKSGTPQAVTILHEEAVRYNPSAIAEAPWLATIEDTYTSSTPRGDFALTPLVPIAQGCAWLRHCRDDATTLPEPEWYSMLGIVGRTVEGDTIAHEWSSPYPRYSKEETTRKLSHALDDAGPSTCSAIRYDRDGEEYCRACQHWGQIKSPIVLGMGRQRDRPAQQTPEAKSAIRTLSSLSSLSSQHKFPEIAPEAFQGLPGELRTLLAPHTESADVALLIQFLTYFGVLIHRQAYYTVEATAHYTNLYACLIGATSRARKGTSYDRIDSLMRAVDTSWGLNNVAGGCGSGEGLIAAVRDPVVKREPMKERGRLVGYQDVEVDPGVIDKRLLVQEPEFASVLKIASREGNTLSMIMRQAWDSGNLRNTVKNNPLMATGAHIAIVGHITEEELRRYLSTTDMANGFANRFLWICVKRSKLLPDGGALTQEDFAPLLKRLHAARDKAVQITSMRRHNEARAVWHAVYPALTADRPGLLGAMLARAEAQVLRLSCIYALLDGTAIITVDHLYAALALWQYVEGSVSYVFGDATGDPTIDVLRTSLRDSYPQGLTKWQITTDVFANHRRAEDINRALLFLRDKGMINVQEDTSTGGRPSQTFFYRPECEESEESEESPRNYLAQAQEALENHREQVREEFDV